ncbi:MAG: FG-GAP repeat protein [Gemmatimonadales bacterium]
MSTSKLLDTILARTGSGPLAAATLLLLVVTTASAQLQLTKLAPGDLLAHDTFGRAISISGDTVVVGAFPFEHDFDTSRVGAVYVFVGSGTSWTLQATLTPVDVVGADAFGANVSISGDTLVIGALQFFSGPGAAYVFVRTGETWTEQAKLTSSDGVIGDLFGSSVSVDGDTVVVGAERNNDVSIGGVATKHGSAYVFVRTDEAWTQQAKLSGSGPSQSNARRGTTVSVSGDTVLVGAMNDAEQDFQAGAVFVFEKPLGGWVDMNETAKLTASDAVAGDQFGFSASLDGNTAVIGAHQAASRSGKAYVFERTGAIWTEQAILTAPDAAPDDLFGHFVSVSGDVAVIGAREDDVGVNLDMGSVYMFLRGGGSWGQQTKFTACDGSGGDEFSRVSIDGGTIVVGASGDDLVLPTHVNSGSAYIFSTVLDTDNDGLFDTTEVFIAGECEGCPDPVNPDSDGDTLLDGDEVALGTDVCNVDSDEDGVPDNLDLLPLVPDVPGGLLEEATRALCDLIQTLDPGLFNGPNDNANKGRRNALANRACNAANRIADGQIDAAIALLDSLLDKVDGADPPPDWMDPSPEKSALAVQVTLLRLLLVSL